MEIILVMTLLCFPSSFFFFFYCGCHVSDAKQRVTHCSGDKKPLKKFTSIVIDEDLTLRETGLFDNFYEITKLGMTLIGL